MSRTVPAVSADAPIRDVLNVVAATRLNRAIVVDENRRVLGVISDADIVERLDPDVRPGIRAALMQHVPFLHGGHQGEAAYRHSTAQTARDLMHTDIVVATESEPVSTVLAQMLEKGKKVVPVVDDTGHLVGIVDRADFLRGIAQQ
jgi:CBS domain-containing protein